MTQQLLELDVADSSTTNYEQESMAHKSPPLDSMDLGAMEHEQKSAGNHSPPSESDIVDSATMNQESAGNKLQAGVAPPSSKSKRSILSVPSSY